jgi:hypothetical protein
MTSTSKLGFLWNLAVLLTVGFPPAGQSPDRGRELETGRYGSAPPPLMTRNPDGLGVPIVFAGPW